MFIQTEATPNPETLKFLPGREVAPGAGAQFDSAEEARRSPLAARLFGVEGVRGVYLGGDFISVTRGEAEWRHLKPAILGVIMEHFMTGAPVLEPDAEAGDGHAAHDGADGEIVAQIIELLDERVRPAVARDGGDITFHGFDGGVVYLRMQGACSGCPSSTATLKHGVENLLRHFVPEVSEVRAI